MPSDAYCLLLSSLFYNNPNRAAEFAMMWPTIDSFQENFPRWLDTSRYKTDQRCHLKWQLDTWDATAISQRLAAADISVMTINSPEYPPQLKDIASPPWVIYYRGNPDCLSKMTIGIVGSRAMSSYGELVIRSWVPHLAHLGIVSGLARGVDAAAHRQTLTAHGITVAVMGTGLDTIYPVQNTALATEIAQTGCLITEFPPGIPGSSTHFPQRNRIISGLVKLVVVIEASKRSGATITARLAAEQGRLVAAVPGRIDNPLSEGCHQLIRDGVPAVTTPAEVLELLGISHPSVKNRSQLPEATHPVVAALIEFPRTVDELVGILNQSVSTVLATLTELEVAGIIVETNGKFALAPSYTLGPDD